MGNKHSIATILLSGVPEGSVLVGNLGFDPGSLSRATGEKVTESEVSHIFRGRDNRQSVLGSWGPSTARESRPRGILHHLLPLVFRTSLSYSLFFHFS